MPYTEADPNLMKESGGLMYAPYGTTLPTNTVAGGVVTDSWPSGWVSLGKTAAGTKISDNATSADYETAEDYTPIDSATTKRVVTVTFNLLNFTAGNLAKALNGAVTTVTGSGATLLTQVDAPSPQSEVPAMLGWESLDNTVRFVARKIRNTGALDVQATKAPNMAQIPWVANCSKPSGAPTYSWFFAGSSRA